MLTSSDRDDFPERGDSAGHNRRRALCPPVGPTKRHCQNVIVIADTLEQRIDDDLKVQYQSQLV